FGSTSLNVRRRGPFLSASALTRRDPRGNWVFEGGSAPQQNGSSVGNRTQGPRVDGADGQPASRLLPPRWRSLEHLVVIGVLGAHGREGHRPTRSPPTVKPRKAAALKRCFGAAVLGAVRIDSWIRRHMIECAPAAPREVPAAPRAGVIPIPAPSPAPASADRPVRPPRQEPPIQRKAALACDRRARLCARGRALKEEYDALATPVPPPRLAALVRQFETLD